MRLIDADDYKSRLKCAFNGSEGSENEREYKEVIEIMLKVLDMQQTAYDVDKVVEQLENLKNVNIEIKSHCVDCVYTEKCDEMYKNQKITGNCNLCELTIKSLVREIVKAGGINENR